MKIIKINGKLLLQKGFLSKKLAWNPIPTFSEGIKSVTVTKLTWINKSDYLNYPLSYSNCEFSSTQEIEDVLDRVKENARLRKEKRKETLIKKL